MEYRLNTASLEEALARLEEGVEMLTQQPNDPMYPDAVIQRFEFTYELSHKLLKRYLELTSPNSQEIDTLAFSDLIRSGSEQGLLRSGWDRWKDYRKARGTTSHTYDMAKAKQVLELVPDFILEVQFLLGQLKSRTQDPS